MAISSADNCNEHATDNLTCLSPLAAWFNEKSSRTWNSSLQGADISIKHEQNYHKARKRVVEAVSSVLGPAASLAHEALFLGVDLLQFAPVPALDVAGQVLLSIWDAVEMMETNRLSCLRLAERCAEHLLAIWEEVVANGEGIADELRDPVTRLHTAFADINDCLQKQVHRPFWVRYVKREEIQSNISHCDALLNDALRLFDIRVTIRTLKLVKATDTRFSHAGAADGDTPIPGSGLDSVAVIEDPNKLHHSIEVHKALNSYRTSQNSDDLAGDMAELRQLLYAAVQAEDDVNMMNVLQVGRHEMPQAIKVLQHALKRESWSDLSSPFQARKPLPQASSDGNPDYLAQDFLRSGIKALKRLSSGVDFTPLIRTTADADEDTSEPSPTSGDIVPPSGALLAETGPEDGDARMSPLVISRDAGYCAAIYPYMTEHIGHLDVLIGDMFVIISRATGWWLVQRDLEGKGNIIDASKSGQGWVPTKCLLETRLPVLYALAFKSTFAGSLTLDSINTVPREITAHTPILLRYIVTSSCRRYAIADHRRANATQLDISRGDVLRVFKKCQTWAYAMKEDNGERGWVPNCYMAKEPPSDR
ncbi:unnamed protein product [Peniophora sp. CBMAI 1063]|nr:unnamed protein product [Peniophora sp. CBMAI 1063]